MQVNASLLELIEASNKKITPCDWTNLPMENPGKYYTHSFLALSPACLDVIKLLHLNVKYSG